MKAPKTLLVALLVALLLPGCLAMHELPPEQPCWEAGYAIAYVTEECTGDRELANARYEAFEAAYTCIPHRPAADEEAGIDPEDLYDCANRIASLSCETAKEFGDDLSQWMSVSGACPLVAEAKAGR
jgi:hypothetical protein